MEAHDALERYPEAKLPHVGPIGHKYDARYYNPILEVMLITFRSLRGKRVLELGFGGTGFLEELHRRGAKVSGLDAVVYERPAGLDLRRGDFSELPEKFRGRKFDVIVCANPGPSEINYPDWKQVVDRLAKNGMLLIHEPDEKRRPWVVGNLRPLNVTIQKKRYNENLLIVRKRERKLPG